MIPKARKRLNAAPVAYMGGVRPEDQTGFTPAVLRLRKRHNPRYTAVDRQPMERHRQRHPSSGNGMTPVLP